ncbi:MAG: hypothetical protein HRU15_12495, partial [Planctomycetes bacterium]|nr:hypothetical protein [Planctomycetota bacterium]
HQYCLGHRPPPQAPNETDPDDEHGIAIWDKQKKLLPETIRICELIAEHDAVLATGHISPAESLLLLQAAKKVGVKRMVVTHASQTVPNMSVDDQKRCVDLGAYIEHSFLSCAKIAVPIPLEQMLKQIQEVGSEHCILSSDFGQLPNGRIVQSYQHWLEKCLDGGISYQDIRQMIVDNPQNLLPPLLDYEAMSLRLEE